MVRVLSIPGRNHENRFFHLYLTALEDQGATIVDPTTRNALSFGYDVLLINFPTHYVTENALPKAAALSLLLGSYLALARLMGRRVVYVVHDVVPFRSNNPVLLGPFLRLTHWLSNAFVFLSSSSRQAFVERYPSDAARPWILTAHGPYPTRVASDTEREQLRAALFGDVTRSFTVGFLGNIKPYKNLAALRGLPRTLPDGRAIKILVAGRVERGHEAEAAAILADLPADQIVRIDERLSDDRLDELIQAVDMVLLPYVKGSNSGVALLVLSNRARLIGSDLPVFSELAATIGPPWAYSIGVAQPSLANAIAASARDQVAPADKAALERYLASVSFFKAAVELLELISRLKRRPS